MFRNHNLTTTEMHFRQFVLLITLFLVHFGQHARGEDDELNLDGRIRRYEVIRLSKRVVKRSTSFPSTPPAEQLTFEAFGRVFNVFLKPGFSVIHPLMRVLGVDGSSTEKLEIDANQFFTGRIEDDYKADVFFSHNDGKGIIGRIDFQNDSLFLEPAATHRHNPTVPPYEDEDVLIYHMCSLIIPEIY
uniref:Pep_M12B_propep domain-containing protein n=1 Tax=Steinernema glaseri TaxID=37863 RepID=A0A1I7Y652_9BILA